MSLIVACASAIILVTGITTYAIYSSKTSEDKPKTTTKFIEAATAKLPATKPGTSASTPSKKPTAPKPPKKQATASQPPAKPTPKPTSAKPVATSVPSTIPNACDQQYPAIYAKYTADKQAESNKHAANLAAIEQDRQNGKYTTPEDTIDEAAYQADVAAENNRHAQAVATLDANHSNAKTSLGCK